MLNEFVSTLPQSGSNSMFDQILEIDYPDYVVDVDNLRLRTNLAITLMKLNEQKPYARSFVQCHWNIKLVENEI